VKNKLGQISLSTTICSVITDVRHALKVLVAFFGAIVESDMFVFIRIVVVSRHTFMLSPEDTEYNMFHR